MKLSLIRNLQIGFGLSLLLLIVSSVASYISIQNLLQSAKLVDHSNLVVLKLENVISTMKDAETGQRGFLLTNRDEFLEPYNGSYQKAVNTANEVQQLTIDNPRQQQNLEVIKNILLKRLNILQVLINKKRDGEIVTLDDIHNGKLAMDALRKTVDKAEIDENGLLKTRLSILKKYTFQTPLLLVLAVLLALGSAIFSYIKIRNDVTERVRLHMAMERKEQETAATNEKLAATNKELTSINTELAEAYENIQNLNEELACSNEELAASNEELTTINAELAQAHENNQSLNEELACSNEELLASNDELYRSQQSLENLNRELEQRVLNRTRDLAESENRFRTMMETIPQIAWTNTANGEVTFYNKQWYKYSGLSEAQTEALVGWDAVIHPDDLLLTLEKLGSIRDSEEAGEFEIKKKRVDGLYRWHLVRMEPVKNDFGDVQLWVGTATDIHELKQLQQQKDDFISIASHELKTPITSLRLSLQLLNQMIANPSAAMLPKLLEQANRSLNNVNKLVEELLDFNKVTMGQIHLNKTQFAIGKLIDDCCENVRAGGMCTIVITGDRDLHVYADILRIEQVIVNFVNNAIKYAPESKTIQINVEKEDGMAKVSVTDKGAGIPAEKLPLLFERYYQAESNGSQHSGLGLGLYIVSEIIKKHDGQFGATSKLGEGSTFWFTLPLNHL